MGRCSADRWGRRPFGVLILPVEYAPALVWWGIVLVRLIDGRNRPMINIIIQCFVGNNNDEDADTSCRV